MEHVALWWTGVVRRHPARILAGVLALTLVFAGGLTQLRFDSSEATMIPSGSTVYTDNVRYQRQFGSDPMVIVFTGANRDLLAGRNLAELRGLQRELERAGVYHAVLGPLTALRFAAAQLPVAPQLALGALTRSQAAAGTADERARIAADFSARTAGDAARIASVGAHSLDNPAFVDFLIHDASGGVRPSLRGVFPDDHHALMVVRLGGRLDIDGQAAAAERVVALTRAAHFDGVRAVATGSPLLVKEINDRMRGDMAMLGVSAAIAMAVVLLLVFRVRWRLLSLGVMVLGVAWGFGAMGYLGLPLTMVTISGLPILIGLGVDFAVQIHSRYESELEHGAGLDGALRRTFVRLGPALTVAGVAAVVGFLALRTSDVPMVRDYGLLLSVGTAAALVAALVVLPAVLSWRDQRRTWKQPREGRRRVERTTRALSTVGVGHRAALLGVSLVIVVVGTVAVGRTSLESDPERWVPQDGTVLRDLRELRRVAGSSADLALMVEAPDVLRPDVLHWMYAFQARATRQHADQLVSANSVASIAAEVTFAEPTADEVRAVMAVAPDDIRNTFIGDGTKRAQILFAIGPISLDQRKELVAQLVRELHAPSGVTVRPSGLAVVGTEAVTSLTSSRESMSYLALGAVFVWLLLAFRSVRRAILVVLPVATAVALGATVIYAFGIRVNTLAAISGPLVIATCTEFTVLIMERYLEERRDGRAAASAVETASFHIGRAFVASGLTTAAGFGVLALSGFPLLSGFGVVVALNVVVALVCALVILPPLLSWSGDRGLDTVAPAADAPLAEAPAGDREVVEAR